jgi:hypothetical protein
VAVSPATHVPAQIRPANIITPRPCRALTIFALLSDRSPFPASLTYSQSVACANSPAPPSTTCGHKNPLLTLFMINLGRLCSNANTCPDRHGIQPIGIREKGGNEPTHLAICLSRSPSSRKSPTRPSPPWLLRSLVFAFQRPCRCVSWPPRYHAFLCHRPPRLRQ